MFLSISLLERNNYFNHLNYIAIMNKSEDGLCTINLMVIKNITPYDAILRCC